MGDDELKGLIKAVVWNESRPGGGVGWQECAGGLRSGYSCMDRVMSCGMAVLLRQARPTALGCGLRAPPQTGDKSLA